MKAWLNAVSDAHYISRLEQGHEELRKKVKEEAADRSKPKEPIWLKRLLQMIAKTVVVILFLFGFADNLSAQVKEPLRIKEAYIESFNTGTDAELSNYFGNQMPAKKLQELKKSLKRALKIVGKVVSMTLEDKSENSFRYRAVHEKSSTLEVIFELGEDDLLSAISIGAYTYKNAPKLEKNITSLILPFRGEWYTFWGGKTTSQNYHNSSPQMRGAYDFWVMGSNGKSHSNGATKNEDFYAFGKDIIAPADGEIVFTADGVKDNNWPSMNRDAAYGNAVMLKTVNNEYIVFAHLKLNSVKVKKGQLVKQGDLLGLCGNSGNSTEPHLHFQVQNIPDFSAPTGAWTYFKKIKVNGKIMEDYLPVRGDKISN